MKYFIFSSVILSYSLHASSQVERNLNKYDSDRLPLLIAVIDTGIDMQNPNLTSHLWRNPGEDGIDELGRAKDKNGIDDDQNGFTDDIHGWNFYDQNSNLQDQIGHGSHITGIITDQSTASLRENGTNVKIMILKYYSKGKRKIDTQCTSNQALSYALKMGAHVVNYSGGGQTFDQEESRLFSLLDQKGVWSIVAAGNEAENLSIKDYYPAKYQLSKMIVVGSMSQNFERSQFSNYSQDFIDLFAFGEGILSYSEHGQKVMMSGTSQATAIVTKMVSQFNEITNKKIKKNDLLRQLMMTAHFARSLPIDSLKVKGSKGLLKRQVIAVEKVIIPRPQARVNL